MMGLGRQAVLSTLGQAVAFGMLTLAGCSEPVTVEDVPADLGEPTSVDFGVEPQRPRRRMDIDQLDQSIQRVTGGVAWERSTVNQFERFSATLGVPDYVETTNEDLDISPLFLKFLDDAATAVCTTLMEREEAGESDVFLRHAAMDATPGADQAAIDENLSYLLLRFHGRSVSPASDELAPWRTLHEAAMTATEGDGSEAWRGVCVALITHPDFYTY